MCCLTCEQKSRTEVDVSNNWKAAIVHVPYPAMKDEIHAWLDVVLVTTRHIWRVPKKGTAVNCSCSRTLIVAHEAIWEDLVYHFEIVGNMMQIYLGLKEQNTTEYKLEAFLGYTIQEPGA
ncbi:hypothetical protein CY35_19G067900 [Sphagnum magellanicum]|nr:hypothetical protein CY35_19G067900 [Sphagnum magellanicum]